MSLPPPSKIRSAQWIVALQHSHYQVQLKPLRIATSKCSAIDSIAHKVCVKHIEGHTVLHFVRTVARVVRFNYPAKPLVQREMCFFSCKSPASGAEMRLRSCLVGRRVDRARPARAVCLQLLTSAAWCRAGPVESPAEASRALRDRTGAKRMAWASILIRVATHDANHGW